MGGPGDGRPGNCDNNLVCGRFGSTLWFADAMASKAKAGYAAFCRQDFIGADYGLVNFTSHIPSPDYWLLLMWQRLIGTRVLSVTVAPTDPRIRVYAFCGTANGTATLIIVNLGPAATCLAPPGIADIIAPRIEYRLTPTDGTVLSSGIDLNSVTLNFNADGTLPSLAGTPADASSPISVDALSVTFVAIKTSADACMG